MTDSFKMWVEPSTVLPKCPNCRTEGSKVNREMCLECGVVFRTMAERQRVQVEVGKELAKIVEWLSKGDSWYYKDLPNVWDTVQKARDCGLL